MQIVIDIDQKLFNTIETIVKSGLGGDAEKAILDGTSLPKCHGRLIILSEDAVKREQTRLDFSSHKWISEVGLSNATVAIIEADQTESEEV